MSFLPRSVSFPWLDFFWGQKRLTLSVFKYAVHSNYNMVLSVLLSSPLCPNTTVPSLAQVEEGV